MLFGITYASGVTNVQTMFSLSSSPFRQARSSQRNHVSGMIIGIAVLAACLSMLLVGSGCQTDTTPPIGHGDTYPAPFNDPQISVLNQELRPHLAFQHAAIVADGDKPMAVQTPVRNLAERQYLIEYRYLFYDDRGMELAPSMPWTFAPLDPKQIVRLSGSAMDLRAQTYRLEVRWSR